MNPNLVLISALTNAFLSLSEEDQQTTAENFACAVKDLCGVEDQPAPPSPAVRPVPAAQPAHK